MDIVTHAKAFASQKHVWDNHQSYGALPYTHHPEAVERVLVRFHPGASLQERAACWLHDVIEDTRGKANEVRKRDLAERFGPEVAALVEAVTSEPGHNRKVRNALTYPKIRAGGVAATRLKLADRIANVEFGGEALDMYKEEYPEFHHALYIHEHTELHEMWRHLDRMIGCL